MPLIKTKGNMYDWITHMHTHLRGACPHHCSYCYVQKINRTDAYKGEIRLKEDELKVNYGKGKTIFIEHMHDLFAKKIPHEFRVKIINHCLKYWQNTYVFQTKNPYMFWLYPKLHHLDCIIGTTIESDFYHPSEAPYPYDRFMDFKNLRKSYKTFITIEPIMDFNLDKFSQWIIKSKPSFVNIGADSKHCGLPEPSKKKILALIHNLKEAGIEVRQKSNLARLLK